MTVRIADKLLKKLDVNPLKILEHRYPDRKPREILEAIAQYYNIDLDEQYDSNPVQHIYELEDRADKCYVWSLDCTDEQLLRLTQQVSTEFVKKYNKDPEALHIIRNDIQGVEELSPEEVREKVKPWLE